MKFFPESNNLYYPGDVLSVTAFNFAVPCVHPDTFLPQSVQKIVSFTCHNYFSFSIDSTLYFKKPRMICGYL